MGVFVTDGTINTANNYAYDAEGRLIKDVQSGITSITWRVDGKVKAIQNSNDSGRSLKFEYDAMGHRVAKHVYNADFDLLLSSVYYILDAQGNTMSVYERIIDVSTGTVKFHQSEKHLFGSSRLGILNDSIPLLGSQNNTYTQTTWTHTVGKRTYELANHLGNVLSVISDKPIPHDNGSGTVDYYLADIRQSTDYSPFGVTLSGRNLSKAGADDFRYGYNNMEADDEIKGSGNSYDFGARMLDPRIGRWLTIDSEFKKYAGINPYHFVFDSPMIFKDPDGKDAVITVDPTNHTVTLSATVYLYGNASEKSASLYNKAFADLNTTRKVKDANDPNITWTVKIDFNYIYDETIATALDKGESVSIPEGANKMNVTNATYTIGEAVQGHNSASSDASTHSVIHETGHMAGFDDRYIGAPYEPYIGDFMSNLANGREYGGLVGPPLEIRDFHFVNLLDFAISNMPKEGGMQVFKTRQPTIKQVVTPVLNEITGVKTGEKVEFITVDGGFFGIDNFPESKIVEKDQQSESRVTEYCSPDN